MPIQNHFKTYDLICKANHFRQQFYDSMPEELQCFKTKAVDKVATYTLTAT